MRPSIANQKRCTGCGATITPSDTHCWVCGSETNTAQPRVAVKRAGPKLEPVVVDVSESDAKIVDEPKRDIAPVPVRRMSAGKKYPPLDVPQSRAPVTMRPTRIKPTKLNRGRDPIRMTPLALIIPIAAIGLAAAFALSLWNRDTAAVQTAGNATAEAPVIASPENGAPAFTPVIIVANVTLQLPPTTQATLIPETATQLPSTATPTVPTPVPPTSIPTAVPAAATLPAATETALPPLPSTAKTSEYIVVSGDTCGKIAKQFGVTVAEMIAANNLAANCPLSISQKLIIPLSSTAATVLPATVLPATVLPATTPTQPVAGEVYTIKPGDTCSTISTAFGISVDALIQANGLDASCLLRAGKTLIIPK